MNCNQHKPNQGCAHPRFAKIGNYIRVCGKHPCDLDIMKADLKNSAVKRVKN
jgi:hypothetical protein